MQNSNYQEKQIEKSFDQALFKYLMKYAKPYRLTLFICFILLMFVTFVDVINPFLIKLTIDDIINPDEKIYGVYTDYSDMTGFSVDATFYSTLTKHYHTPTTSLRVIKQNDQLYGLDPALDIGDDYQIVNTDEGAFIKTKAYYKPVQKMSKSFKEAALKNEKYNLKLLAIVFISLLTLGFLFNYFQALLLNLTSQKIIFTMRAHYFGHLLSLDLKYFDKNPVGRLVTRVTNDLNNINEMYTSVLLTIIKDIMMLISIAGVMLYIDVKLTLICLSTFPLVVIATLIFRKRIRPVQREVKIKLADINAKLSEYISGMNIIQIFGVEESFLNRFKSANNEYYNENIKQIRIFGTFRPMMSFIYSLGLIMLLIYGTGEVLSYHIELGVLIAFTRYIKQFYQPIFDFSEKFNIMQSAMASAERLYVIDETTNPIQDPDQPKQVKKIKGDIEFKNVWFAYTKEDYVLKDVSFNIKAGETVAIVGHTGSGKTTLTNLISRFYDVNKGDILIDGINIKDYTKPKIRKHIGMVLQDVFMFSDTVSQNIKMYDDTISEKRVKKSAELVGANTFISKLDEAYNYQLKERGAEFSTGQRQLISFARALAYNPEIMILDEATSNIDTETEQLIQQAIDELSKKRTTIVIAHRLSTIVGADKIIVLNKGEVCEIGNHQSLIQKDGLYRNLYELQFNKN